MKYLLITVLLISCGAHQPADKEVISSEKAPAAIGPYSQARSEEHTSELQSQVEIVCRLPLEKKNGRAVQQ